MSGPYAVAVVGSGPSGFYTAGALLALRDREVWVDMYERLPTPWGLVRAGVAPDHPKIKSVSAQYENIMTHKRFRFFGGLEVGSHVGRDELAARYDVVVYAVGAPVDRALGIPGEDLPGSVAASDFVGWYNGHPDYHDRAFDLRVRRVVVIGNGNVALDVARILSTPPDRLAATDIADHALAALRSSTVEEVVVVGRRGAAQAAFTTPELRELGELTGAAVHADCLDVGPGEDDLPLRIRRNLDVLRAYAGQARTLGGRRISLRFLRSPIEIRGEGRVGSIVLGRNVLRICADGTTRAFDTGEREVIEAGLVIRAIGYRGVALPGLPFDERRGVILSLDGRIADSDKEYVVGWAKRGPSGVIGTNKKCASETVRTIVADLDRNLRAPRRADLGAIEAWLRARQPDLVDLDGWAAINVAERRVGELQGRPRVKLCTRAGLLAAARRPEKV